MMSRVVVTGASSFIGINLTKELLKQGYYVYAVVRNPDKLKQLDSINHLKIILCDLANIKELSDKIDAKVDIFYHLAWNGTRAKERDDVEKQNANIVSSIDAMKVAKQLGCNIFIGIGSQAEYGRCEGQITEEYPTKPITEYGKAKLVVYQQGEKILSELNLKFIWARIFSVYGVGDYEGTLISNTIQKMLAGESVALTQCVQTWDFIHVYDVAKALVKLIEVPTGVYNIANGDYHMLRDFVLRIKEIVGSDSELLFGAVPYGPNGAVSFEPNANKLKNLTGWEPIIDFDEGIEEIIKEQRKLNG